MKRKTLQEWERILGSAVNEACKKLKCRHAMPDHGLPLYLVPLKEEERRKAK